MKNIRFTITGTIKRSVDNPNWGILMNSASRMVRQGAWDKLWDGFKSVEDILHIVINKKI